MSVNSIKTWLYYGAHAGDLEQQIQDLADRGGRIISVSIAYGPPPARIVGNRGAPDNSWHAMVVVDTSELRP